MKFLNKAFLIGSLVALVGTGCTSNNSAAANKSAAACFSPAQDTQSCDMFDKSGTFIRTIGWSTNSSGVYDTHCLPNLGFVRCRDRDGNWMWPQMTSGGVCPFKGDEAKCPTVKVVTTTKPE